MQTDSNVTNLERTVKHVQRGTNLPADGQRNSIPGLFATVDITYVGTSRYENMLVLELNDGKHPGKNQNRDDFGHAAGSLTSCSRTPILFSRVPTSRKKHSDNDHSMNNCDQILSGKVGIIGHFNGRRHHLHLQQSGTLQEPQQEEWKDQQCWEEW